MIPVSELIVINDDITSRREQSKEILDFANPNLPNPDDKI